ncbi:MAG TPA: ATP-binding protein [Solirubrobacterales bacterium]|nr:ATP-binding protein [Solirubrobacterales bacterium]
MSRVPIRLRITAVFALAMAVVLAGLGLFVYLRLGTELDRSIEQGLRSRAGEVAALARAPGSGLGDPAAESLIEGEESFAQIVAPDGRVLDSTPQLGSRQILSPAEVAGATSAPAFHERDSVPGLEGRLRLLVAPVEGPDGPAVAVVGTSLEDRDEALARLATLLLVGGLIALPLASLAGYGAAAAALRPVEAMRTRADAISASHLTERLPLPTANDELRRLGETLNEMLDRLEAAIERERRFVDDASHELRTPLTLHRAELELALRHAAGADELRAAIVSAMDEVDRLIRLAEDLLVVARSEQEGIELEREPVALDRLLAEVADRFRARASADGRELAVDGGGLIVEADRQRLDQALTSLIDNALGHGSGAVTVVARSAPERVELHVRDRGPGFEAELLPRVFERFSRAGRGRGPGGAGLGLAIVDAIARAHGGRAVAANVPRDGADVWIELPAG